jgi:hypothetical protein
LANASPLPRHFCAPFCAPLAALAQCRRKRDETVDAVVTRPVPTALVLESSILSTGMVARLFVVQAVRPVRRAAVLVVFGAWGVAVGCARVVWRLALARRTVRSARASSCSVLSSRQMTVVPRAASSS